MVTLDSSRDLQPIHAKNFVNRLHLVLQISKIPFHLMHLRLFCVYRVELNTPIVNAPRVDQGEAREPLTHFISADRLHLSPPHAFSPDLA